MSRFDFKNKRECLCLFVGQVKTSKKITNHSKTYGAPELIGRLGRALAQGHNYPVGIWKMVVPLSYNGTPENCHNPKNGPLKKSLPKFAQPWAGCMVRSCSFIFLVLFVLCPNILKISLKRFDHLPWCGHAGVVDEANSMGNQHCCHRRGAVEHFYLYEEGGGVS